MVLSWLLLLLTFASSLWAFHPLEKRTQKHKYGRSMVRRNTALEFEEFLGQRHAPTWYCRLNVGLHHPNSSDHQYGDADSPGGGTGSIAIASITGIQNSGSNLSDLFASFFVSTFLGTFGLKCSHSVLGELAEINFGMRCASSTSCKVANGIALSESSITRTR